ncbi:MAG: histidine phosphatase family protein [Saprospiraceae bacterium]|nr:histidine phosphatase family protein [Saprospiraceae bacterium]
MADKAVAFIRHAKSSWSDASLSDLERPLNERGLRDAPRVAKHLAGLIGILPMETVCSPARRARQTCELFARQFPSPPYRERMDEALYFGNAEAYTACLHQCLPQTEICLVFGHNPTIEHLAGMLRAPYTGQVPTCCVLLCKLESDQWQDAIPSRLRIVQVIIPKLLDLR